MQKSQTYSHKIILSSKKINQNNRLNCSSASKFNEKKSDQISFIKTHILKEQDNKGTQIIRNMKNAFQKKFNRQDQQNISFKNLMFRKENEQKQIQKEKRKEDYIKFVKRQIQKNESNLLNTRSRLAAMLYGSQNKKNRYQNLKCDNFKNKQMQNSSNSCLDLILNNRIQLKQSKNNYSMYQQHLLNLNKKAKRKSLTSEDTRRLQKITRQKKSEDLELGILSARQMKLNKNRQDIKYSLWGNFKKQKINSTLNKKTRKTDIDLNVTCFQQAIHFKQKKNVKFKQQLPFNEKQINIIKLQAWQIQTHQMQDSLESRFQLISKIIK